MELILVGVVHRDPEGQRLLERELERLAPSAITVELSPYGLLWREKHSARCLSKLHSILQRLPPPKRLHREIQFIRLALELPFEYRASKNHADSRAIPLFCVDHNSLSRRYLQEMAERLITESNIRALVAQEDGDPCEIIHREYQRARLCLSSPWLAQDHPSPLELWRERFMACRIRRVAERFKRVVHVGGWTHLLHDPKGHSLFCLLEDLSPKRVLLRTPAPSRRSPLSRGEPLTHQLGCSSL